MWRARPVVVSMTLAILWAPALEAQETAIIHIHKKQDDNTCEIEKVNPSVFPPERAKHGDELKWMVQRAANCNGIDVVRLAAFVRVVEADDGVECVEKSPLADCEGTWDAQTGKYKTCSVSLAGDDNKMDRDWEYRVCGYDKDGKGALTLVSELDPTLQTRGGENVDPPLPAPAAGKRCMDAKLVCPKK